MSRRHSAHFQVNKSRYLCGFFFLAVLVSCSAERPVDFAVYGSGAQLRAYGKAAAAGFIDFKNPKKLEYAYLPEPGGPPGGADFSAASLELEYSFSAPPSAEIKSKYQLVFESEGESWLLPMDCAFAGIDQHNTRNAVFHYAIPIRHSSERQFSVTLLSPEAPQKTAGPLPAFQIHSLELKERWYGFFRRAAAGNEHFYASPFVYARAANAQAGYVIDPPPDTGFPVHGAVLSLDREEGARIALSCAGGRLEVLPGSATFTVSGAFFQDALFPLELSGALNGFELRRIDTPVFPRPLPADPGLILHWPEESWRDRRFEVFRWDRFPSLLIFDTADYAVQDRLFKRLAFFVEKAGFRGRLASDAEIAALHGWNAHDYRADDLAAFFEAARISNFPLLREERELQAILAGEGIIRADSSGAISGGGGGGVISISRASPAYLRAQFMAHEGFHGLFFIDEDFRAFSRERWLSLPRQFRAFVLSYFDYQRYDINDEYLAINEYMAHILQQPVQRTGAYFGETLPRRLESSPWRPPPPGVKDEASNSWPALAAAFTREAQAFSDYVYTRWGLSGGRVWLVYQ